MAQVFQVQVLVAGDEFVAVDVEGIYEEVKEVLRHGTVVDKTADVAYLAFLYFFFSWATRSALLAVSSIRMSASREILMQ